MDSTTTPATISGKFITRNFTSRDAKADSERVESRVRDWEKRFRDRDEKQSTKDLVAVVKCNRVIISQFQS